LNLTGVFKADFGVIKYSLKEADKAFSGDSNALLLVVYFKVFIFIYTSVEYKTVTFS